MPNTNKSPSTLVVNTYNILPWCRLDYLGLGLQCVSPLLWLIDPNYGIPWQPVCHFCVGSVPIAVLVILHFPVLVCSIFNRVLFGCYPRTAVHNILFLVSLYLWHTSTSNKISTSAVFPDPCDHTWVCKEALSFPNALDCVPKAFPYFCYPMPAVCNIDHWVIWLGLIARQHLFHIFIVDLLWNTADKYNDPNEPNKLAEKGNSKLCPTKSLCRTLRLKWRKKLQQPTVYTQCKIDLKPQIC